MSIHRLESRALIRIHGPDAAEFLQNTLTNDIRRVTRAAPLQYNLLLTPQGQILHELFVVYSDENDYILDIFATRKPDLLRRLMMFRLRAKVSIDELPEGKVYASMDDNEPPDAGSIPDPRRPGIGYRIYITDARHALSNTADETGYSDALIATGIPAAETIRYERDYVHDMGLEKLNAIAWDKGCFIGQEVAARVEHRGLAKKGLFTIESAAAMDANAPILTADGLEAGEIRQLSHDGRSGLALLKKMMLENGPALRNAGIAVHLTGALPQID